MAHALTLHFSTDPHQPTRLLTMIDLQAECPVCGYEEIQRFYHPSPFHTLTLPRLRRLIHEAPALLRYDCSNCATPVTEARRGALTLAFAEGAGTIRVFFTCQGGAALDLRFLLLPDLPLDPQSLPAFDPPPLDRPGDLLTEITDKDVFTILGRAFNLKASWRALLQRPAPTLQLVAPEHALAVVDAPEELSVLVELHRAQLPFLSREYSIFNLLEPGPLSPHLRARDLPGRPAQWLDGPWAADLKAGRRHAFALLGAANAAEVVRETLESARLSYEYSALDGGIFTAILTPREAPLGRDIGLGAILARAAWTSITAGEAARMTAEEAVAELIGLTTSAPPG